MHCLWQDLMHRGDLRERQKCSDIFPKRSSRLKQFVVWDFLIKRRCLCFIDLYVNFLLLLCPVAFCTQPLRMSCGNELQMLTVKPLTVVGNLALC